MFKKALHALDSISPAPRAHAHCDGPCGVYDPASARVAAEAVKSMLHKINDLKLQAPSGPGDDAFLDWNNKLVRYTAVKEEEAEKCKSEILILWTDFFKQADWGSDHSFNKMIHDATALCSKCKQGTNEADGDALIAAVKAISDKFWTKKGKDQDAHWYLAKP